MHRRHFLATLAAATAPLSLRAQDAAGPLPIKLSLKCGMANFGANLEEKFRILKEIGYDGVELDSPGGQDKAEALAASKATGLPIHGVVDSIHWQTRLSDPDAAVREKALQGLLTAIRESHAVGGSAVLLVPGVVDAKTTHDEARARSIEGIRKALPLASELGIHILIENVWNRMMYQHDAPPEQGPEAFIKFVDSFRSPWVGMYYDIGNHWKYGRPGDWIRAFGHRCVKLDVKGFSRAKNKFVDITSEEDDLPWTDVQKAIDEVGFSGWATAEVGGGGLARLTKVREQMQKAFGI